MYDGYIVLLVMIMLHVCCLFTKLHKERLGHSLVIEAHYRQVIHPHTSLEALVRSQGTKTPSHTTIEMWFW